jgi:hypothetical protein
LLISSPVAPLLFNYVSRVFNAVNRGDVRMTQRGKRPGLALESRASMGVRREQ